jgi:hypothetical protein
MTGTYASGRTLTALCHDARRHDRSRPYGTCLEIVSMMKLNDRGRTNVWCSSPHWQASYPGRPECRRRVVCSTWTPALWNHRTFVFHGSCRVLCSVSSSVDPSCLAGAGSVKNMISRRGLRYLSIPASCGPGKMPLRTEAHASGTDSRTATSGRQRRFQMRESAAGRAELCLGCQFVTRLDATLHNYVEKPYTILRYRLRPRGCMGLRTCFIPAIHSLVVSCMISRTSSF